MKIISNKLYESIPLLERLKVMPYKKLLKLAIKKYGLIILCEPGYSDKSNIIDEILTEVRNLNELKERK